MAELPKTAKFNPPYLNKIRYLNTLDLVCHQKSFKTQILGMRKCVDC